MIPDIRIADAQPKHVDAIAALEREAFPSPWKREFFTAELAAERRYNRAALLRDGSLVGYLFSMYFLDELHVNKIAVAESYRRSGVALALMDDCLRFAKAHGVEKITLEVRVSNIPAQSFYRKLHFVPIARRPQYYPDGEAAVVMIADVDEAMRSEP